MTKSLMHLATRIRRSDFLQSVAVLGFGAVSAHAIMLVSAPILARLYTPADFGLAALFAAIVGSVAPAICGKYEVAVVVAKTIRQSRELLGIALLIALSLSTLVFFVIWLFDDFLPGLFKFEGLGDWILLIPLALLFTGVLMSLNYYSNRLHEYRIISQSKVLASLFSVTVGIVFGLLGLGFGLLLSNVLATATVSVWLLHHYRNSLGASMLSGKRRKRVLAWRYRDFPIYNASTGLFDGLRQALPIFFLSHYFSEAVVGYYALMLRVAMGPISFVASAVSQVNLKKVADLVNQRQGVQPYFLKVTLLLVSIVVPLLLVLTLYAAPIFAWAFGENWRIAGNYLQILMPALALRFVVSTLSTTFGGTGNNRLAAIWKITAFVVTFGAYWIVAPRVGVTGMFMTILITDLVLYGVYYVLALWSAGHPFSR